MDNINAWVAIAISLIIGVIVAIAVHLFVVPWQRREITGSAQSHGPVKFTINDSTESTPSGSPKKNRRPTSFVQNDSNPLPAITEQTELTLFANNLGGLNPSLYTNDKNGDLANSKKKISKKMINGNYKIDPKIVEKAELLLGKDRSLDNTDLTVTSLNFIDDHQHHNGYVRSANDCRTLQTYFDTHQPANVLSPNKKAG